MKQRVAFKRRMNNLLPDVQSGAFERRRSFVSIGYLRNRPHLMPSSNELGRYEHVRYITSEQLA